MGCGVSKKKIPTEEPGKILKTTGVPEFDEQFNRAEEALEVIKKSKDRLQECKIDFVKCLGAEKHWSANNSFKELIKMMVVSLAIQGKGDLDQVGMVYEETCPYINVEKKKLTKPMKKMMVAYEILMEALNEIPERLSPFVPLL
jgi:hypothetical protein